MIAIRPILGLAASLALVLPTAGFAAADDSQVQASFDLRSEEETPKQSRSDEGGAESAEPARAASGLRVYIDPATGRLLPEAPTDAPFLELSKREVEMLDRSDFGLERRWLPGGSWMVDLQGRFRHMTTVTLTEDGAPRGACVGHLGVEQEALREPESASSEEGGTDEN